MIREVTAMDARKNFGEILNEVKYRHDTVLIKKAGKPIAAIIDLDLFDRIKAMKHKFDALTEELGKTYEGFSVKEAENEVEEALKNVRKNRKN
jgi:prevent-host-death family protein